MKHIKVTGCLDCSKRFDYGSNRGHWYCLAEDKRLDVQEHFDSKTIHPDCPLEDFKELKEDVLSLLYQISNSQVGSFGTWKGYISQLNCDRIKGLIDKLK